MDSIARYVINLRDRSDRRFEMENQLARIGWEAQFLEAVRPDGAGDFPSIGARGCFLSHLAALRQGRNENSHVLIMEDDLNFKSEFAYLWRGACEALEKTNWSIFYPAHLLQDIGKEGLQELDREQPIICAHFVLFNKNAISTVIGGLEDILSRQPGDPLGGPMHVDGAYSTIRAQNPLLSTFIYVPSLGYQRSSRSDIAALKAFDRVTILRPLVIIARKIKQELTRLRKDRPK